MEETNNQKQFDSITVSWINKDTQEEILKWEVPISSLKECQKNQPQT